MPTYHVKKKGIYADVMYDPDGKRPTITVDKPFTAKNKPSWIGDLVKKATARKTAKKQTNVSGTKGSSNAKPKSKSKPKAPKGKK